MLSFRPEDGAEVIATGKLTTYPGPLEIPDRHRSRMELAGEGALMALLESAAGRSPPKGCSTRRASASCRSCPRVIGVVTSPTGAVIRDILHRLEDRCPTHVIVWPVPVQGEGASAKIAAGDPRVWRA